MRRATRALAVAGILPAGAVVVTALVVSGPPRQALAAQQATPSTATVMKRRLSAMVSQAGILTFRARSDGSPYSVINQVRGTYTQLPAVGKPIRQGQIVYRVNEHPVVLLYGPTPAYRTLSFGAKGRDVAELNADLRALGYGTSARLHPGSSHFGAATTAAVKRLQASVGTTRTGRLALGQAVFEPAAIRVTTQSAQPGGSAQTGQTVLLATSTTRQVQVALAASQQTDVAAGDKVTVTLPDNRTTPGVVSSVATVATCPSVAGGAGSGSSSGSAPPGTDSCSSGGSGSSTPTIAVGVRFSGHAASGVWDQAPVQVGITTASVSNALVVPVAALLARSAGGYAVEVVGAGAGNHLVPVSLGLFDDADGLVQVTASGLTAGQQVVVPST